MGVPIVFHHVTNQPHTPSPHFASFPTRTPRLPLYGSIFLPAPPQYQEPSISSTISLPLCEPTFISPTSYRNSPMGPPPFISFPRKFCPPWATHITLGHPFLYLYISPQIIRYLLYKRLYFQSLPYLFVVTFGDLLPSFLAKRNPCHPWLEHYLSSTLVRHHPYLQSTPQVTYLYPLNLFTLSRLWHNLSPSTLFGLVVPLPLDLVTWLRPLFISYILQPRAVLSLPTS
jgi:hypothetical protein